MSERIEQAEARLDLVGGGRWLRSSGYHVQDGFIRLQPGAELEIYDPWEEWRTAADEDRPYKRLLRLAQQLHPPRLFGPLPRREQRSLEKWVQENGLLGILPHETRAGAHGRTSAWRSRRAQLRRRAAPAAVDRAALAGLPEARR